MRPYELPEQARFAHARLTDHRNDLTVASLRLLERAPESLHLGAPAHESGESPLCRRLESRTRRADSDQLVDLERLSQALDGHQAKGPDLDIAFDELEGAGGEPAASRRGELLHPRGQVYRLPDRRVVHVQIAADRPHHDLSRVESDSALHVEPLCARMRL